MAKVSTTLKSGTILYGKKPKPLGQVNMGDIVKAIGEDAGAMMVVKTKEADKLIKDAQAERKKGKCMNPVVQVGQQGSDLVFLLTADKGYAKVTPLVKKYEAEKAKAAKTTVVNMDPKDKTIKDSSKQMAKAKGTTAKTADKADLNKKGDKAPIVILAHGSPAGKSPGKVYAKEFADKKPADIVKYLVKDKKLDKGYAGVVYLDGCFTAAGSSKGKKQSDLNNFSGSVYKGLKDAGYKYLQVKGNLGEAVTLKDGSESVLDAQEQKKIENEVKKHKQQLEQLLKAWQLLNKKYEKESDDTKLQADPAFDVIVKKYHEADKKLKKATKVWKKMSDTYDYDIKDLVGTFGPEKHKKKKWYKEIFG